MECTPKTDFCSYFDTVASAVSPNLKLVNLLDSNVEV